MGNSIKGIIVEIGGDTSGLQNALKKVNSVTSSLSKELRGVNSLLKLDTRSPQLLAQKHTLLKESIAATKEQLKSLKEAQSRYIESGGNLNTAEYRNLERQIILTEEKLKKLKFEASNWTKAGESLKKIQGKMSKIGESIFGAGKKLTTSISAPIAGLMTAGVKYNSEIEKYKTALTTLTGSSEKANKIIQQIKSDAEKTPFDVAGLTQANQLLISTGLDAKQSRETILALGNAISATGGGNEELSRMAVNLQQIKNVGKASSLDIKQFAYAGIDVYGMLADYLGITKEKAAKMTVTWEDMNGALIHASQKGGKYFSAMEKQSNTFNGKLSNLKESFNNFTGQLAESLMPVLSELMTYLTSLMNRFKNLSPETQKIITKVLAIIAAVGPLLMIIGKVISIGGTIMGVLSEVFFIVGKLSAGIKILGGVFAFLTSPIGLIIAAVVALVAGFAILWNKSEKFRNFWIGLWNGLKNVVCKIVNWIKENWKTMLLFMVNPLAGIFKYMYDHFEGFRNFVNNVVQSVVGFFKNAWENIKSVWSTVAQWFSDNVIEPIKQFFIPLIAWFKNLFTSISNFIKSVFKVIVQLAQGCVKAIKLVWGVVSNWFKEKIGKPVKNVFSNIWNKAKQGASGAWNKIKEIWSIVSNWFNEKIATPVKDIFKAIWNNLKTGATGAWTGIKKVFSTVATFFKNTFESAWTAVKKVFSTGGKIFNGIKDGIVTAFKKIVNAIITGINKVVSIPFNAINKVLDKIRSVNIAGAKPFSNLGSISVPQIPQLAKGGIVNKATLAEIGEGKSAEAVIPLDKTLTKYIAEAMKETGESRNITVNFYPQKMTDAELDNAFNYINKKFGMSY